ncbi:hypothetical protein EYF80_052588 [Liparis tanakae]|uniref:Uncharacterized protein n=1 Tax=Liparis tanakae TaxID=230148 RepID=A0A4Z2F7W6_9TELE|nr:hypothetical protein EYF80_052588 [Liparis tanakae]
MAYTAFTTNMILDSGSKVLLSMDKSVSQGGRDVSPGAASPPPPAPPPPREHWNRCSQNSLYQGLRSSVMAPSAVTSFPLTMLSCAPQPSLATQMKEVLSRAAAASSSLASSLRRKRTATRALGFWSSWRITASVAYLRNLKEPEKIGNLWERRSEGKAQFDSR